LELSSVAIVFVVVLSFGLPTKWSSEKWSPQISYVYSLPTFSSTLTLLWFKSFAPGARTIGAIVDVDVDVDVDDKGEE
jgi:hypothetical protein